MLQINKIHHTAIICSDYERSKYFYTQVLGCTIIAEYYRKERDSYKLDLAINDVYTFELFSFPDPPVRVSRPEAAGLRHVAFEVNDIEQGMAHLKNYNVECESVRVDEYTGKRFTFFTDPDGLPLEFYEK